jgi:hypothetical protein
MFETLVTDNKRYIYYPRPTTMTVCSTEFPPGTSLRVIGSAWKTPENYWLLKAGGRCVAGMSVTCLHITLCIRVWFFTSLFIFFSLRCLFVFIVLWYSFEFARVYSIETNKVPLTSLEADKAGYRIRTSYSCFCDSTNSLSFLAGMAGIIVLL